MAKAIPGINRRYAEEYLVDLNQTEAYRRARGGKIKPNDKTTAHRVHMRPAVQKLIAEMQAARSQRTQITQDSVLAELSRLGFANMADYITIGDDSRVVVDLTHMTRDQAAAISELTVEEFTERDESGKPRPVQRVKFKLYDKRGPLTDLGKHLGMFITQKLEVENAADQPRTVLYLPEKGSI